MNQSSSSGMGVVFGVIWLAVIVLLIVSMWKVFEKAGKPGWAALIPIYNMVVMLEIINRPIWWIALFFVPIANFIIAIMMATDMAECFGKSKGWGVVMLVFLGFVGYPMLAFSDAKYTPPVRQA